MTISIGALLLPLVSAVPGNHFGRSIAVMNDVDGDRVADWIVSEPWGPGVVQARSGRNGALLWSAASPRAEIGWGDETCPAGDQDGDGTCDVAVHVAGAGMGDPELVVLSGRNGRKLHDVVLRREGVYVESLAGTSDRNGRPEFVYCEQFLPAPRRPEFVVVRSWSAVTRSSAWIAREMGCRWFAPSPWSDVDLNGDGVPDLVALRMRGTSADVVLLSGRDGARVDLWAPPSPTRGFDDVDVLARAGSSALVVAVATGVGSDDRSPGRLLAFERGRAVPSWQIDLPDVVGDHDLSICARHDVTGDGFADVVVGDRYAGHFRGRIDAYDGARRARIWTLENHEGEDFGSRVVAHPDLDGDGVGDYLVTQANPYYALGECRVAAVSGKSGRELYRVGRSDREGVPRAR